MAKKKSTTKKAVKKTATKKTVSKSTVKKNKPAGSKKSKPTAKKSAKTTVKAKGVPKKVVSKKKSSTPKAKNAKDITKFSEKQLNTFMRSELLEKYPGWFIEELWTKKSKTYSPDFILSRPSKNNKKDTQVIVVDVISENAIKEKDVAAFKMYVNNLSSTRTEVAGQIMVYPTGCRTTSLKDANISKWKLSNYKVV